MEAKLRLSLLGTPQILSSGDTLSGFVSSKAQALLYYLAVTGRPHSRQMLLDLFWDKMRETDAAANLRTVLSNLRRLVGEHLTITRQTVTFNRDQAYWLDVDIFEAQAHNAKQGISDHEEATLQAAIDLYSGDFLEGFYLRDAPNFEEWVLRQRERLRQLALQALYNLATYDMACGRYAEAMACTVRLLDLDPWHEDGHCQMMLLLAYNGQRRGALGQYETCRNALDRELGMKPAPQTTDLYHQILDGTIAVPTSVRLPSFVSRPSGAGLEQQTTAPLASSLLTNVKHISQTTKIDRDTLGKLRPPADTPSSEKMSPADSGELDLAKLLARCACASDSAVQVVLLNDPARISRTRLLQMFQHRYLRHPHSWIETNCLPNYRDSPLRPIVDMIERNLCLQRDEPLPIRFAKLLRILEQYGLDSVEAAPYLLALFSLPLDQSIDLLDGYSSRQMEATLSALVSLIQALAAQRSLVLLVRDIQWCDRFSLRLLDLLAGSGLTVPILILLTNQVAFGSTLDSRPHTPYPRIIAA
jgi:DNA-binding SARP family transcriptional activator